MDCVRVEAVPPTPTDAAYFAMLLFVESPYVKRQLGRYQIYIYLYRYKYMVYSFLVFRAGPTIRILGKPFGVCLIYQVILWIPWHKQHRSQCPSYVVVLTQVQIGLPFSENSIYHRIQVDVGAHKFYPNTLMLNTSSWI